MQTYADETKNIFDVKCQVWIYLALKTLKYIYFNLLPTRVLFRLEGLYANFAELEKPVQKRWLVLNFYGPIHPRAGRPCRTDVGWPHSCTVYLFSIFEKCQWVNIRVEVARWKKLLCINSHHTANLIFFPITLCNDLWLQIDGIATKCKFCQRAYCGIPLAFQK